MTYEFPRAAELLFDQLDVAVIAATNERRRLNHLRTFLPSATWATRPTDALLEAIARTERDVASTEAMCADIRGAIEKLRTK
jgi:hypothetical protein